MIVGTISSVDISSHAITLYYFTDKFYSSLQPAFKRRSSSNKSKRTRRIRAESVNNDDSSSSRREIEPKFD